MRDKHAGREDRGVAVRLRPQAAPRIRTVICVRFTG